MGLLRWFAKNWASTDPATHSDLVPLVLPLDTERATEQVRTVVAGMPRWQVEVDSEPGKGTTVRMILPHTGELAPAQSVA